MFFHAGENESNKATEVTPQVGGFFSGDFEPEVVIVIRPPQLGIGGTYLRHEAQTMSSRSSKPYIPTGMGEVRDFAGSMVLGAPRFVDKTGFFPNRNVNSEFFALTEGLKTIQRKLGEDNYQRVVALARRAQAHFEADPDDKTGDTTKGLECLMEIEEILKVAARRKC